MLLDVHGLGRGPEGDALHIHGRPPPARTCRPWPRRDLLVLRAAAGRFRRGLPAAPRRRPRPGRAVAPGRAEARIALGGEAQGPRAKRISIAELLAF